MRGEVLVAIIKDKRDFAIAHDRHWYRIPVSSVENMLKDCWPPRWLALYQPKEFGPEQYSVRYYARVLHIDRLFRHQLFPDDPLTEKSRRLYYKLSLDPLRCLPQPILSRRSRRITFIPTTWQKFVEAAEINDLWDGSKLEDRLWKEFKRLRIDAERQNWVTVAERNYALDFDIHCADGHIDVETDGDVWHATPERAPQDNIRDNALKTLGYRVLRFSEYQIKEELERYCLPTITENISRLGGLNGERVVGRKIDPQVPGRYQPSLFDDL